MLLFGFYSRGRLSFALILLLVAVSVMEAMTSNVLNGLALERGYRSQMFMALIVAACFATGILLALCIRLCFRKATIRKIAFHFFMFPMFVTTTISVLLFFLIKAFVGLELIYVAGVSPILLGMRLLYTDS